MKKRILACLLMLCMMVTMLPTTAFATEEVQNVILNNLSKRLAVMIKEDMEYMGPVRMKDVEEAQQKIVNIIRKLEDSAEIVIARGGGDEIIV